MDVLTNGVLGKLYKLLEAIVEDRVEILHFYKAIGSTPVNTYSVIHIKPKGGKREARSHN